MILAKRLARQTGGPANRRSHDSANRRLNKTTAQQNDGSTRRRLDETAAQQTSSATGRAARGCLLLMAPRLANPPASRAGASLPLLGFGPPR